MNPGEKSGAFEQAAAKSADEIGKKDDACK